MGQAHLPKEWASGLKPRAEFKEARLGTGMTRQAIRGNGTGAERGETGSQPGQSLLPGWQSHPGAEPFWSDAVGVLSASLLLNPLMWMSRQSWWFLPACSHGNTELLALDSWGLSETRSLLSGRGAAVVVSLRF